MAFANDLTLDAFLTSDQADARAGGRGGPSGPVTRVHVLSNEFEAHVLLEALEAERIEALVEPYRDMAFDSLFVPQRGWGAILTREEDAERAVQLIADTLANLRNAPVVEPEGDE